MREAEAGIDLDGAEQVIAASLVDALAEAAQERDGAREVLERRQAGGRCRRRPGKDGVLDVADQPGDDPAPE